MNLKSNLFIIIVLALTFYNRNVKAQTHTNSMMLALLAKKQEAKAKSTAEKAIELAKKQHWDLVKTDNKFYYSKLIGVDQNNHPIFYTTYNNIDAAATVGTAQLWPGGNLGINVSGSSANVTNKLGIWDGGRIRESHIELKGRIKRMDSSYYSGGGTQHATHVCGTMMAKGINPLVKGMAFNLQSILTYDFDNDLAEVTLAAGSGLLISNHSYGSNCGWNRNWSTGQWEFWGNAGDTVDYNFGYYDSDAQTIDDISFNSPYYLMVRAGGNDRDQNGPAIGQPYSRFDSLGNMVDAGIRPAGISNNDSYTTIPTSGNAKNILTVGAVSAIINGYTQPSDVKMTSFSSWGPTNDGRIKPDLVADGVNVQSTSSYNDSDYEYESGTSMASPNIAGSLLLLQEYYSELNKGNFMRAATLKGLAIHTANEAGDFLGPDYRFGWGLLNAAKAAVVIAQSSNIKDSMQAIALIDENILKNSSTYSRTLKVLGNGKIKATLSWTDPAGKLTVVNATNKPTTQLVNDLDLRIVKGTKTYYPWVLNPNIPAAAAIHGDNNLDNIEQIITDSLSKGSLITINVTHKGSLFNNSQAFSLIVTQEVDTLLPLKLIAFTANPFNKKAVLMWATTEEINVYNFEVERSEDGINWVLLGKVSANNALSTNNYAFTDDKPFLNNLYRLKILNKDGTFTYSSIERVAFKNDETNLFTIAPNPAKSQTTLQFNGNIKQATINLIDSKGSLLFTKELNMDNRNPVILNTSNLSVGVYFVSIKTEKGIETKRMIINK